MSETPVVVEPAVEPAEEPRLSARARLTSAAHGAATGQGLRARFARGSSWTLIGYGAQQAIRLGSNLILTRILLPEAFGLMLIVNVVVAGLEMFSDIGLKPAVIQSDKGDDPAFLNTAWSIQIMRGLGLWGVACVIAYPVALLYGQPELTALLMVAGLSAVANGFQSITLATSKRKLTLWRFTLAKTLGQVVGVACMITLAVLTESVWALVIGSVISAGAFTVLSYVLVPGHTHAFRVDREHARAVIGFGKWIMFTTILGFVAMQADKLVLGAMVPIGLLGAASVGFIFGAVVLGAVRSVQQSAVLPALSELARKDPPAMKRHVRRGQRLCIVLAVPVGLLAGTGDLIIDALYPREFLAAGPVLMFKVFFDLFGMLALLKRPALTAMGMPKWNTFASVLRIVLSAALAPVGYVVAGPLGVAVALMAGTVWFWAGLMWPSAKHGTLTVKSDVLAVVVAVGIVAAVLAVRTAAGFPVLGLDAWGWGAGIAEGGVTP